MGLLGKSTILGHPPIELDTINGQKQMDNLWSPGVNFTPISRVMGPLYSNWIRRTPCTPGPRILGGFGWDSLYYRCYNNLAGADCRHPEARVDPKND